jgi:hypothetical protein
LVAGIETVHTDQGRLADRVARLDRPRQRALDSQRRDAYPDLSTPIDSLKFKDNTFFKKERRPRVFSSLICAEKEGEPATCPLSSWDCLWASEHDGRQVLRRMPDTLGRVVGLGLGSASRLRAWLGTRSAVRLGEGRRDGTLCGCCIDGAL